MKPAKKLTLNLAWLYAGEMLAKALPMVLFAWLARVLGRDRFGDLEAAIQVWFVLNLAQEAGLGPYGGREAAKAPERTARLVAVVVLLRAALVGIALLALGALVIGLDRPAAAERTLAFYGLVLIPAPLVLNWVFQARDEMPVVAGSSVLRQSILCGGAFLLVRGPGDGWIVPACDAAGIATVAILHQVLIRKRVGGIRFAGVFDDIGRVVREALPLAASTFVWAIRLTFPTIALWTFTDGGTTALFGSGHRLVVAAHTFVWLYFFNLLPSLARASLDPDRVTYRKLVHTSLRIVGWTVLPGCLLLSILSPFVMPLVYGPEFTGAAAPFSVSVWMLAAAFVSGHMRYALIAFSRQLEEFRAALVGAAVSVGACLWLGSDLTPMRAAVIFLGAETATLVAAELLLSQVVEPLGTVRRLLRPVLVVGVAGVAAWVLRENHWLAAAAAAGICGGGVLLLERTLGADVRRFLAQIRGK